jgi:hypothetical protein
MDNKCYHCFKKIDWKYQTKKIKTKCGHHKLYHYHCFMNLSEKIKDKDGNMCCFHCKELNNIFKPIIFVKFDHNKIVIKKLQFLINHWNHNCKKQFDKLIIFKKMLCLIENNIDFFKTKNNFIKVFDSKMNEVINLLEKKPELDVGLNIKSQASHLKKIIKI